MADELSRKWLKEAIIPAYSKDYSNIAAKD